MSNRIQRVEKQARKPSRSKTRPHDRLPISSQPQWGRLPLNLKNGEVLVGSDFHIWPGAPSTCLRAFKKFDEKTRKHDVPVIAKV